MVHYQARWLRLRHSTVLIWYADLRICLRLLLQHNFSLPQFSFRVFFVDTESRFLGTNHHDLSREKEEGHGGHGEDGDGPRVATHDVLNMTRRIHYFRRRSEFLDVSDIFAVSFVGVISFLLCLYVNVRRL